MTALIVAALVVACIIVAFQIGVAVGRIIPSQEVVEDWEEFEQAERPHVPQVLE